MENQNKQILIVDNGSQYTLVIARVVTSLGVQCRIVKPKELTDLSDVRGVILSGGPSSVYDNNAPKIPDFIFDSNIPILGICYGAQYMAYRENKHSVFAKLGTKEYGPASIEFSDNFQSLLFEGLPNVLSVWASHGDTIHIPSNNYITTASSMSVGIQAIQHKENPWYGIQFHPEVDDTKDDNKILKNFIFKICKCEKDWDAKKSIHEIIEKTIKIVGSGKAVMGVSGGVDSTTLAAMLAPLLKNNLHCVLIDHGGMRQGEVDQVVETCAQYGIDLSVVEAADVFLAAINSTVDAEEKRKLFSFCYKQIFLNTIKQFKATHVIQGTLATDLIESGHAGESAKIKSHHNVGLDFGIPEIRPFEHLFKHEVRDLAKSMNLDFSQRQPFPGPGLYIRVIGTPVSFKNLELVRRADYIVTNILKDEDWYEKVSQLVVGLIGIQTVGVQGDERSYMNPIVIRAIQTGDFMTGSGVIFPEHIQQRIISELTSHTITNRVFFDPTPKPPATTELE